MKTKFFRGLQLALLLTAVVSCQKEEIGDESSNPATTTSIQNTEIKSLMGITNFPVVKQEDGSYRHDDIILFDGNFDNPNTIGQKVIPQTPEVGALAINGRVRKWPNNLVIYKKSGLSGQLNGEVDKAMREWSSKTSIRFKEHTNESYFVTIRQDGSNCNCGNANLGVFGTRGTINLGSRSSASLIVHEIGHTLGYIHEQNRGDRDEVINVNFDNISQNGADQYFKSNSSVGLTSNLDPLSIMMYSNRTFGNGRGPTMTFKDGSQLPRKSGGLSAGDIAGTNSAYPGNGTGTDDGGGNPTTPTTPKPNPKNPCDGVAAWSPNQSYSVGAKVTYRGFLFERDFSRWNMLQKCGVTESQDICNGVSEYNRSTAYSVGSKVKFRGNLYRRVNGGWIKEGQCGN